MIRIYLYQSLLIAAMLVMSACQRQPAFFQPSTAYKADAAQSLAVVPVWVDTSGVKTIETVYDVPTGVFASTTIQHPTQRKTVTQRLHRMQTLFNATSLPVDPSQNEKKLTMRMTQEKRHTITSRFAPHKPMQNAISFGNVMFLGGSALAIVGLRAKSPGLLILGLSLAGIGLIVSFIGTMAYAARYVRH